MNIKKYMNAKIMYYLLTLLLMGYTYQLFNYTWVIFSNVIHLANIAQHSQKVEFI